MKTFDFGYLAASLLAYAFMGFIYGLIVYAAVGIVLDAPIWPIGLTLFFSLFHLGDLRRMAWHGRFLRTTWLFMMASGVSGIVWLFVPKEDWLPPTLLTSIVVLPLLGAGVGFVLGLVEGSKPNSIRPYLRQFSDWWTETGGY